MKRLPLLLLALICVLAVGSAMAQSDADTLVIAINADVQGFNSLAQTSVTNLVSSFLWPTLVNTDPQTGEVIPNLATWDVSEDGLTYTFHIDPDANWSDGTPITADDVKFFFEATQSPTVGSFLAGTFNWTALDVVDSKTLSITLPAVDCTFLTNILWGIMPSHKFAADFSDYNTAAVNDAPDISGGPYILDEHSPDEFIRMRANPDYFGGAPHIQNLVFQIIPDSEVAFQALMSGDVDIAAVSADQDPAASSNSNLSVVRYSANVLFFTAFNMGDPANPQAAYDDSGAPVEEGSHPVFGDVRVRHAFAMGYDHDAVTALAGEGAQRSVSVIAPSIAWAYDGSLTPTQYDPDGAAALLEEAGWVDTNGDGVREKDGQDLAVQLDYMSGDTTIEGATLIIQDQLSQIGFRVNLNAAEWQSLVGTRLLPQTYDVFYLSIGGGVPEPDFLPNVMVNSHQDVPNAGLNIASYVNPAMDEALAAGRSVVGCAVEDRAPFYQQIQQMEQEDMPYDFVFSPVVRFVYNNRITGIAPGPWGAYYNIQDWTLGG